VKILKNADIKNKSVLLRVDFNVTLRHENVVEDYRMRAALPTVKYLLEGGAEKIILISHLGRPDGKYNSKFSLKPVSDHLAKMAKKEVEFLPGDIRKECGDIKKKIQKSDKRVLFLDNLRFYDEEEKNDKEFSKILSGFGEVFVEDAFGVCHRNHASVVGVSKILPSYAGLLLQKEIEILSRLLNNPDHPLTFIIGGAKISTKLPIIERFLQIADNICIGGALANTILKAEGTSVGKSLVEESMVEVIKRLKLTDRRLHLPVDVVCAKDKDAEDTVHVSAVGKSRKDESIFDIGPDTVSLFSEIIRKSKVVVWNGPLGYVENKVFARGTDKVARSMANATSKGIFTIIGGGDTYLILEELNLMDKISFVSTGGGAMLDFLAKGTLPGIEALS